MSKKRIGYMSGMIFAIALICFMFIPMMFQGRVADAQCVDFKLVSCTGGGCPCGVGWTKVNEVESSISTGAYGAGSTWTALCIGGP